MIPIHELLNRIRWDEAFAQGDFVIGYYDQAEQKVIRVPLQQIHFTPDDHFFFRVTDTDSYTHEVPLHRIKEVTKDGELIWHREH